MSTAPIKPNARIAAIATEQHGVITRAQLLAEGVSKSTISRWLSSGRLFRLHPCVFAVGHAAPSRMGLMLAALFASSDRAAIARRTSLEVWRVWRVTSRAIDVAVVGRTRGRSGVDMHHTRRLPEAHVRVVDRVRVTSPARTLVDLALDLDARQLANVIHEMKYRKVYDRSGLQRCIADMRGTIAEPVVLTALDMERIGSAGTKSELERRVHALLLELGREKPKSNIEIDTPIGWIELDCCWPDKKVYLEVDGPPHARRRTKNADRDKAIALRHLGWRGVRIGYLELDLDRAGVSQRLIAMIPRTSLPLGTSSLS